MSDDFRDQSAEELKKNQISKHAEEVSSVESAVLKSLALSWDTVMEHAVKPKIAQLFKPREAREQGYKCGMDVFNRLAKNDEVDAYADIC